MRLVTKILALLVLLLFIGGCQKSEKPVYSEMHFKNTSIDEVLNGAKVLFKLIDRKKFIIDSYSSEINVTHFDVFYEVLNAEIVEDHFDLEVFFDGNNTTARLYISRKVNIKGKRVYLKPHSPVHKLFWNRLSYILGKTDKWERCLGAVYFGNMRGYLCDNWEFKKDKGGKRLSSYDFFNSEKPIIYCTDFDVIMDKNKTAKRNAIFEEENESEEFSQFLQEYNMTKEPFFFEMEEKRKKEKRKKHIKEANITFEHNISSSFLEEKNATFIENNISNEQNYTLEKNSSVVKKETNESIFEANKTNFENNFSKEKVIGYDERNISIKEIPMETEILSR